MSSNVENIYSLAPLQRGLWFHAVQEPESFVYHQQLELELEGPLDPQRLRRTFTRLIQRHAVLRTAFAWEDLVEPLQVVLASAELPYREVDLRADPSELGQIARAERERPFDLTEAPLMRVCVARIGDQRWRCVWTHHHLILDGWSVGLLLEDFRVLYGAPHEPRPPAYSYADFIAWLDRRDAAASQAYFRAELAGLGEPTALPRLAANGGGGSGGAERSALLDRAISQQLRALADAAGCTWSNVVIAAWGLLLARHAGSPDALIGVTVAGRSPDLPGAETIVGMCINTLPLRVAAPASGPLRPWLSSIGAKVRELSGHAHLSLSAIKSISELPPERPMFESIVVVENYPIRAALAEPIGGLNVGLIETETAGRNDSPLSLVVAAEGDEIELRISFSRARFDDAEVARLLEQLANTLAAFVSTAEGRLEDVGRSSAAARERMLARGAGAVLPGPRVTLPALIREHARRQPMAAAVCDVRRSLSYAELDRDSDALSAALRARGFATGGVIAIALERSVDFVVSAVAVWKLGCAYVAFDSGQPAERVRELLVDSGASVVITTTGRARALELPETQVLALDAAPIERFSAASVAVAPADAAYVIYTSGSTGRPKGVVVEHAAIVEYARTMVHALELSGGLRFGWVSSAAADLGHTAWIGALVSGGCACVASEAGAWDAQVLSAELEALRIDVLKVTPGHLRGLLRAHPARALLPRRSLVFGGEALDGDTVRAVRSLAPEIAVFNHYGPTESVVGAVVQPVPDPWPAGRDVPLGRALPNRRLYVLDERGELVPEGVPGELYIGGDALAREYLGRPEQTRERFLPDPFRGCGRMYRTGDRVRWYEDGTLAFLGRTDHQVKIRGFRVELGEVEAALQRVLPTLRDVAVRAIPAPGDSGLRLVAYLAPADALDPEALRVELARRLPDAWIPSAFVALPSLPRTANGKLDAARLPLPAASAKERGHVAPRSELERKLASIWASVLRAEQIGVFDNFFALGGDSILSLQIVARARQEGVAFTPRQLFECKTIDALARAIEGDGALDGGTALAAADARSFPLTPGQRARLEATPEPSWRLVKLAPELSEATLARALGLLEQLHPALRCELDLTQRGSPRQRVREARREVGIRPLAAGTEPAAVARSVASELGLAAFRAGASLLLVAHPLCLDDESWPQLLEDLARIVSELSTGREPRAHAWLSEYVDHAEARAAWAAREDLDDAWAYWLDRPRAATDSQRMDAARSIVLQLSAVESAQLRGLAAGARVELDAVVAAALAAVSGGVSLDLAAGRIDTTRAQPSIGPSWLNPSRTVGALSYFAPCDLPAGEKLDARGLAETAARLAATAARADEYGALRYVSDNLYMREPLAELPRGEQAVRWLGDWDRGMPPGGPLRAIEAASEPACEHALQLCAWLQAGRLCLSFRGARASERASRVEAALRELASSSPEPLPPSAASFPLCPRAAELPLEWGRIEDVYPLSPMQHGMLVHTLLSPNSGIYLMQQHYAWEGPLDPGHLARAWQGLIDQHPVMRTAFHWQAEASPVQCVYRDVSEPPVWFDLAAVSPLEQSARIALELENELARGLDLARAPLTRLRVFRLAADRYTLVRSFHHILTDAWCFGLLMEELLARYRALVRGELLLRAAPRPYRDYIAWREAQDTAAAERFYREQLAELPQITPLPGEARPRSRSAESVVGDVEAALSLERTAALQALCQSLDLTPNTWVQGAWALLLARHARTDDVVFGVTVSGRPAELPGVEDMVGLFIHSLPLRVKLDRGAEVGRWLGGLLAQNLELRRHEHVPLPEIARYAGWQTGAPLFETLVVFENAPFDIGDVAPALGVQLELGEDRVHTNYAITVVVYPGERLGIRLSFDRARYDRPSVQRLLDQLLHLLEQMIEAPEAALASVRWTTADELEQLRAWNETERAFPLDRSYASLVAERVQSTPAHVVASCGAAELSYSELWRQSGAIARALEARGVGRDDLVVLIAPRGLALLSMLVGTLRARAAFLCLEIAQPAGRLREILQLSAAKAVLVSEAAAEVWRALELDREAMTAEALWRDALPSAERAAAERASSPDDLAYVVFTSGSTGVPKGVMVEGRGLLNNLFGKLPALDLGPADRIAQTASCAFDIAVWQFLAAPLFGAHVRILPDAISHDPRALVAALDRDRISVAELVPAVIKSLLDAAPAEVQLGELRWLLPTGEALDPRIAGAFRARFPRAQLMNAYGPAECSDDVAMYPLPAELDFDSSVPIGRPTPNNRLYVVDDALAPVPIGAVGEIVVAGAGVGRGYLGDPQLTAARFVAAPALGERVYRTGDLGRWRADGQLEFTGRVDHQVKLRGYRIELPEIERRLSRLCEGAEVAVVLAESPSGEPVLAAYCESARLAEDLRRALALELPDYMVPARITCLQALPRTASGKLDRKALLARGPLDLPERDRVAARTPSEARVIQIWQEVLGCAEIGATDHFFELGGHSLLATQVVSRIRASFGIELPLRAVFAFPTVAELAAELDRTTGSSVCAPALTRTARQESVPLSFAQQRLWFHAELAPDSRVFQLQFALRLQGRLDRAALARSLSLLVERHAVLRSEFESDGGEPRQRLQPSAAVELESIELDSPADPRALELEPVALSRAPLLRARLSRVSAEEHVLLLGVHHIAVDGWSLAILIEELAAAYSAYRAGLPPELTPLAFDYADYASWERAHVRWDAGLDHFKRKLAGAPLRFALPGALETPGSNRAERVRLALAPEDWAELQELAAREHTTLFTVLYAAMSAVIHQQTGLRDFLVGTDAANRPLPETERMVGFFINPLVLRSRVEPEQTVRAFLAGAHAEVIGALEHQAVPFDLLVAELLPQRDRERMPFFQHKLVLQNTRSVELALPGLSVEEIEPRAREAELDLLINAGDTEIVFEYRASRFNRGYIERLAHLFEAALSALAASHDESVATLLERLDRSDREREALQRTAAQVDRDARRKALGSARRRAPGLDPAE